MTRQCRGLVVENDSGEIVGRTFPKFWELGVDPEVSVTEEVEVCEKIDGSLILVFHYRGQWLACSRGSFTSPQAEKATGLLKAHDLSHLHTDTSYLFELIYPENRIVVDYGPREELVFVAAYKRTGPEVYPVDREHIAKCGFSFCRTYSNLHNINELKGLDWPNEEGFVVRFSNGHRVKLKFPTYMKLHTIYANASGKGVWEHFKAGKPLQGLVEEYPDELHDYLRAQWKSIQTQYDELLAKSKLEVDELFYIESHQEFRKAISNRRQEIRALLLALRVGKPVFHIVCRALEARVIFLPVDKPYKPLFSSNPATSASPSTPADTSASSLPSTAATSPSSSTSTFPLNSSPSIPSTSRIMPSRGFCFIPRRCFMTSIHFRSFCSPVNRSLALDSADTKGPSHDIHRTSRPLSHRDLPLNVYVPPSPASALPDIAPPLTCREVRRPKSTTITLLVGISGAGKSTLARELRSQSPSAVIVSRDLIRNQLFGYTEGTANQHYLLPTQELQRREKLVGACEEALIQEAVDGGLDVIVDDTNLHPSTCLRLVDRFANCRFRWQPVQCELEVAKSRNSERIRQVPAEVIEKQFALYEKIVPRMQRICRQRDLHIQNNAQLEKAVIVDLDGTLANLQGRNPYDSARVKEDLVNHAVLEAVLAMRARGCSVIICSGRSAETMQDTVDWLNRACVPFSKLYMRKAGDRRPDFQAKEEMWRDIVKSFFIVAMFDDRNSVVRRARMAGFPVFQVNEGNF